MNENGPYRVNLNEATMKAIDEEFGDHATKFAAIVDEYISLNIEKGEFTNGFMGENPSMLHVHTVNSIFVSRHLRRLCESILLGICRLTDGYKRTTGIRGLPEMIAGSDHTEIERLVNEALKAADPTIKKIETWRKKRIAHRDTVCLDREIPKPTVDATLETIAKMKSFATRYASVLDAHSGKPNTKRLFPKAGPISEVRARTPAGYPPRRCSPPRTGGRRPRR